jgi:hypothetical protein
MNRVMDIERAVTPTCWARRAALGWKAACAAAPERSRRGISPGAGTYGCDPVHVF